MDKRNAERGESWPRQQERTIQEQMACLGERILTVPKYVVKI
jgi:hypothetical protein